MKNGRSAAIQRETFTGLFDVVSSFGELTVETMPLSFWAPGSSGPIKPEDAALKECEFSFIHPLNRY